MGTGVSLGTPPIKKIDFFRALPKLPPPPLPPIRASCTTFFGRQKRRLARITEPSNDGYDNDVSDNCDHNFGTFDDFGVKHRHRRNVMSYRFKSLLKLISLFLLSSLL